MIFLTVIFALVIGKFDCGVAQLAKFRILAPQFICPKGDGLIDELDNTVITIQTAANTDLRFAWSVRWSPLQSPSQRATLLLWKTVRALEAQLNKTQPEPLVYVIENNKLLQGIDYIFNVTAIEPDGTPSSEKSFHIDNTQGDHKLDMIEGRGDMMSLIIVGAQTSYATLPLVLDAQVTTCTATQDYYFIWTIQSSQSDQVMNVSRTKGNKLVIPQFSLVPGDYDVNCQVIKQSNGYHITQTGLPIEVIPRDLQVYLSVDYLLVTINHAFIIETLVVNNDFQEDTPSFEWNCTFSGKACENFEISENPTLFFPAGLPEIGQFEINVQVSVGNQSATAGVTIVTVEPTLPVIVIAPIPRIVNEGSIVSLTANASNVAPTCTLTWYFSSEMNTSMDFETTNSSNFLQANGTLEDGEHGIPLADTLTVFSLQENFLNELTDFTNETEWRQMTATMPAAEGRARFVAHCGCSLTFDCDTLGTVYADVNFKVNESPKVMGLKVFPESGTALETSFRLSTVAAVDPDTPLRYLFYCAVGTNDSLLLDYFVEQPILESVLPYAEGGTEVWIEVCDSYSACSRSESLVVQVSASNGTTMEMMIEQLHGHARRCELVALRRVAVSSISSYANAGQQNLLSMTEAVKASMDEIDESCVEDHSNKVLQSDILSWIDKLRLDNSL